MERAKYRLHVKIYPSRSTFYPNRSIFFFLTHVNGPWFSDGPRSLALSPLL